MRESCQTVQRLTRWEPQKVNCSKPNYRLRRCYRLLPAAQHMNQRAVKMEGENSCWYDFHQTWLQLTWSGRVRSYKYHLYEIWSYCKAPSRPSNVHVCMMWMLNHRRKRQNVCGASCDKEWEPFCPQSSRCLPCRTDNDWWPTLTV